MVFSGVQGEGSEEVRLCRIVKGGGRIFLIPVSVEKAAWLTGGNGGGKFGAENKFIDYILSYLPITDYRVKETK